MVVLKSPNLIIRELLFNVHINDAFPKLGLFACQIRLMELVYATFLNWFFMLLYNKSPFDCETARPGYTLFLY